MKVILYMAMSLDGYIADKNRKTPWSEPSWENYKKAILKVGNLVIGYQTYLDMKDFNEFQIIGNPKTIVFTSKGIQDEGNFIFVKNHLEFEQKTKELDMPEIIIGGGTKLNSYFLENNLVDEIFIDVESYIFGTGLKLFSDITRNIKLELLGSEKYGKKGIQLHYKVYK